MIKFGLEIEMMLKYKKFWLNSQCQKDLIFFQIFSPKLQVQVIWQEDEEEEEEKKKRQKKKKNKWENENKRKMKRKWKKRNR